MIKSITKVTAAAAFKWVKTLVPGVLFSIICLIISIILISNNSGSGMSAAGHTGIAGALLAIPVLFTIDFWVMLLMICSLLAFPLYFVLANKLALQTAISSVWKHNLQDWFVDKITRYLDKTVSKSEKLNKINDYATAKLQLADAVRKDSDTSKWQKKILSYILKKIRLDDIDFSDENISLSNIIAGKINDLFSGFVETSNRPFYLALLGQLLLLILAFMFDQK